MKPIFVELYVMVYLDWGRAAAAQMQHHNRGLSLQVVSVPLGKYLLSTTFGLSWTLLQSCWMPSGVAAFPWGQEAAG